MKRKAVKILALVLVLTATMALGGCNELKRLNADTLTKYTIDLVYDDEAKKVTGTQKVDYINNYDIELYDIYFHLYPAAFREGARFVPVDADPAEQRYTYPNGFSAGGIEITKVKVKGKDAQINIDGQDDDILIVVLETPLMPTDRVTIEMEYTVTLPNIRHRFGYNDSTVNLGNFYPIAAVYENGTFNTDPYCAWGDPFYSEVAAYEVSITAPKKYTAAMSGVATATETGDTKRTYAAAAGMRDFAIVLGEFQQMSGRVGDTTVIYYYYGDSEPEASLQISLDSVKTFNDMFGKYPYKSLSVVETEFNHGGMEYPGLVYITDREEGELYRDIIVHEIAHEWWYAAVGNNQLRDAWLDESLAEYSATLFYEKNPGYGIEYSKRITDALSSYLFFCDIYSTDLNTAMSRHISEYRNATEYTQTTYVKGQIMYDTLRKTIGDTAFFEGLKHYYADNIYKIAIPDNLVAAFEKASKRELKGFFDSFVNGNAQIY